MACYLFLLTPKRVRIFDFFGKPAYAFFLEFADAPESELSLPHIWQWFQDYRADADAKTFSACVLADEREAEFAQALVTLLANKGGYTEMKVWPPKLFASFYRRFYPEMQVHNTEDAWQVGEHVQRVYALPAIQTKSTETDTHTLTAADVQRYLQRITARECLETEFD